MSARDDVPSWLDWPEHMREHLLRLLPAQLARFRAGQAPRFLQIPYRAEVAQFDPDCSAPIETAGFSTVTVDLAIEGADESVTLNECPGTIPGEAARAVEREIQRQLAEAFHGRRLVDGEPNELTQALAGTNTVTVEEVRAVAQRIYDDLRVETDADGGWPVPLDLQGTLHEATFRGVPIRYRRDGTARVVGSARPAADREDSVVERSIDATCTPWELVDVEDDVPCPCGCEGRPSAHQGKAALSWDEFMKQSASLIDEQERRRG